jgi:hypothetical protein
VVAQWMNVFLRRCNVLKILDNPEPSTHGPLPPEVYGSTADAIGGGAADVRQAAAPFPQLKFGSVTAARSTRPTPSRPTRCSDHLAAGVSRDMLHHSKVKECDLSVRTCILR